jgi:hypothetical protein
VSVAIGVATRYENRNHSNEGAILISSLNLGRWPTGPMNVRQSEGGLEEDGPRTWFFLVGAVEGGVCHTGLLTLATLL